MQTDATSANNSQRFWVLLANNVASVCMGPKVLPVANYTQQVPTTDLLAFFDFLPTRLMFPQIIRSTQLDTPCYRRFHEANIVGVPCKRVQHCCATLHRSQNNRNVGTCWAKSLTGFKLYATSANKYQHCCGSMQTDATSHNIVANNVRSNIIVTGFVPRL